MQLAVRMIIPKCVRAFVFYGGARRSLEEPDHRTVRPEVDAGAGDGNCQPSVSAAGTCRQEFAVRDEVLFDPEVFKTGDRTRPVVDGTATAKHQETG